MWVLVTYDVSTQTAAGRRRLRRISQTCKSYGQRVQKSVFECAVDDTTYERMKARMVKIIDVEQDSIRFYRLPGQREGLVEEFGKSEIIDFEGPLVV